jgi:site-specific DNA recombinase
VAVHPNMAGIYRERVANLRTALAHEDCHAEAAALIRTLIDRIELAPVVQDGRKTPSITLHGALAGILGLAAKAKGPLGESDPLVTCTKLVAGARKHLCRTLMPWTQPYRLGFLGAEQTCRT